MVHHPDHISEFAFFPQKNHPEGRTGMNIDCSTYAMRYLNGFLNQLLFSDDIVYAEFMNRAIIIGRSWLIQLAPFLALLLEAQVKNVLLVPDVKGLHERQFIHIFYEINEGRAYFAEALLPIIVQTDGMQLYRQEWIALLQ